MVGRTGLLRERITKLYNERVKAKGGLDGKGDKNPALSEGLKRLLTSSYGKFIQKIIETVFKIFDNNDVVDTYYQNGQVLDGK